MDRLRFAALLEQHQAFPNVLESLLAAVEAPILRQREKDGRWSPLEILAHVLDEEREDFRPRAQLAAAGRPIEKRIDPVAWVTERRYNEKDPETVRREFAVERLSSCAWLRSLELPRLEAAIEHPQLGRMRCGDFIAAWRLHDLLHLRQLATALAVLTARELSPWRVDYAGRIPTA